MRWKEKVCLTLCVLLQLASADITLENNGYQNVIVSISPDIPETEGQQIIEGIRSWISQGSQVLFSSTKKLSYIASVQILIPQTWTGVVAEVAYDVAYEDGSIRVESANPVYGNFPYTVQAGGCGERGEAIMVTPAYFLQLDGQSTQWFGPPGNIFVHEWAKFRYGVFEEYGYPGDLAYPMFYLKPRYTSTGVVTDLKPNFCTNEELQGHNEDFVNGGPCSFDDDGLPNQNCLFVPNGDNSQIRSSMMAAPFLTSTESFCESGESLIPHDRQLPTKHNALCSGRSTWDVIESNADFVAVSPSTGEFAPSTVFTVLRPAEGQFVMVLDTSGSMGDQVYPTRLDKLKQSTIRWTMYDVRDGSYVGVTSFSSATTQNHPMAEINNGTRQSIIDEIDQLEADGGTCLGAGVRQGLRTLAVTSPSGGGVMIFVTDGNFDCPDDADDQSNLDDPALINEIIASKVRIVTIAFGESADQNLENLARITNGKTYTISDDSGIEDINDALQGCLTYQPSVPTSDMDFVIFTRQYEGFSNNNGAELDEFIIDRTIGRDVKIQIDYSSATGNINIDEIQVTGPSYSQTFLFQTDVGSVFVRNLQNLTEGTYNFIIHTNGVLEYANAVITSKAKDGTTLPFNTKCWASAGSEDIDAATTPLVILAQVTQGNRAVMNAQVEAMIERLDSPTPILMDLLDNGSGADHTANDGLYSRYFTRFDNEGAQTARYILKCQVKNKDSTEVNGGFIVSRRLPPRGFPLFPPSSGSQPPCCGSNTVGETTLREPTGNFSRLAAGGSIHVVNFPGPGEDPFPPVRVLDLSVRMDIASDVIVISFTSPGDNYDEGIADSYDIRYSDNATVIFDMFEDSEPLNETWVVDGYDLDPIEGGTKKEIRIDYDPTWSDRLFYFAMKTNDSAGNFADVSNVVGVYIGQYVAEGSGESGGLSDGEIAGIVIGCLSGVLLISFVIFFFVRRKYQK